MLLARDIFFFSLHHPPFSSHFIACGISLPSQDIYYIFPLKIPYAPLPYVLTFLAHALKKCISFCTYSFGSKLPGKD